MDKGALVSGTILLFISPDSNGTLYMAKTRWSHNRMNLKKPVPLLLFGAMPILMLGISLAAIFLTEARPDSFYGPSFSGYVFGTLLHATFWLILPYFLLLLLLGSIACIYTVAFHWVTDYGPSRRMAAAIWLSSSLLGAASIVVGIMCGLFLSAMTWSLVSSAFGASWSRELFTTRGLAQLITFIVGSVFGGSIVAASLGLGQWWFFRRSFPDTRASAWVKMCVLNWPVRFAISVPVAAVAVGLYSDLEPMVPLGVVGAFAGISVGIKLTRFTEDGRPG